MRSWRAGERREVVTDRNREVSWKSLRAEFPDVPFSDLLELANQVWLTELDAEGLEILRLILAEKNDEGKREREIVESLMRERLSVVSASMLHNELDLPTLRGVDREHVQAYVVYGLLMPSSARTFAGARGISPGVIREFVSRKLGARFNEVRYQAAERYLIREGVIDTARGHALNLRERDPKVTELGRVIITESKRLLFKYRPAHGKES